MRKTLFIALGLLIAPLTIVGCGETPSTSLTTTISFSIEGKKSMAPGSEQTLKLNSNNDLSQVEILWDSSDKTVATISSSGVVSAIFDGETTITATLKGGNVKDSFVIKVAPEMVLPKNTNDIQMLLNNAAELEYFSNTITRKTERTDSNYKENETLKKYANNFYTVESDFSGGVKDTIGQSISFYGKYNNSFYQVYKNTENEEVKGSSRRLDIVDSVANKDLEISSNTIIEKVKTQGKVQSVNYEFASKMNVNDETNKHRVINTKVDSMITDDNKLNVNLEAGYLFEWANGIDNDYVAYSYNFLFDLDGYLYSSEHTYLTYPDSSFDIGNNKLKDGVLPESKETYSINFQRGEYLKENENKIIPTDYLVSEIKKADYVTEVKGKEVLNTINKEDFLYFNKFRLSSFEPATALDITSFVIESVVNPDDKVVLYKDKTFDLYKGINAGQATINIAMTYNRNIKYSVVINVLEEAN